MVGQRLFDHKPEFRTADPVSSSGSNSTDPSSNYPRNPLAHPCCHGKTLIQSPHQYNTTIQLSLFTHTYTHIRTRSGSLGTPRTTHGLYRCRRWAATAQLWAKMGLVEKGLADRNLHVHLSNAPVGGKESPISICVPSIQPVSEASQGISQEWRGCVAHF
jgi:hypothetical protein